MKKINLFIFLIITLLPINALALIEIDITRGNLNPLPIAVSSLSSNDQTKSNLKKELKIDDVGLEISKVIENNFRQSGLFNPLAKDAFLLIFFYWDPSLIKNMQLNTSGGTMALFRFWELQLIFSDLASSNSSVRPTVQ